MWFKILDDMDKKSEDLKTTISNTKSKILELAMQGKLVPQDPTDEPAADMLRRVNPKARIITDNPHSWNIPLGWTLCMVSDAITSPSSKPYQIPQKEILPKGDIPVISQSSNFIEGYTNCSDKAYPTKDAIIIFGDHTRNVKYYTHQFVVGADGVKLIEWNFDKKFLYYCLLYVSSKIQNKGYSRHFQYLSSYRIGIPPLNEQIRIVSKIEDLYYILDEIEASLQSWWLQRRWMWECLPVDDFVNDGLLLGSGATEVDTCGLNAFVAHQVGKER